MLYAMQNINTMVQDKYQKPVATWLLVCVLIILFMVTVGGYTRLTDSGLSITEWKPIHGTIPPMNEAEWMEEFDKYRQIPQYQQVNKGMSLGEFKQIYWPEYWHRNLGRFIGLVYALPLFFFFFKGAFSRQMSVRLFLILLLGGGQGLIGWIMVASGLQDRVYVHHIKLALHFGMAMLLISAVFWTWLGIKLSPPVYGGIKGGGIINSQSLPSVARVSAARPVNGWVYVMFALITLLIFTQLIFGAFVAGLRAGLIYNTFPLMNGDWIAPDVLDYSGAWFDSIPTIQFVHRWLAKVIVLAVFIWLFVARDLWANSALKRALIIFNVLLFVQFLLGVLTLINVVPLGYALLHQLGGVCLLLAALNVLFWLKKSHNNSVQHG